MSVSTVLLAVILGWLFLVVLLVATDRALQWIGSARGQNQRLDQYRAFAFEHAEPDMALAIRLCAEIGTRRIVDAHAGADDANCAGRQSQP